MKVNVIKDKCIGCGNCVALTESTVFDYNDEGFANGEIYDQFPKGNEVVNKGATVQLYVSLGPSPVVMPDLKGKTYDEAVMILAELGFNPEKIHKTEGIYPDVPVNTVYYQETSVKPDLEGKVSPECEVYLRINTSENSVSSLPTTETVPVTSVVTQQVYLQNNPVWGCFFML